MKIEKPGKYVTREGQVAVVNRIDMPGDYPIVGYIEWDDEDDKCVATWTEEGFYLFNEEGHESDIVEVYRPKVKREAWINIRIPSICPLERSKIYETEESALRAASNDQEREFATVKLEWEEPAR